MSRTIRATSLTLRSGVVISFSLLIVGLILHYVQPQPARLLKPSNPVSLVGSALRGDSVSVIHFGVLLLMMTPLARVIILTIEFFRNREMSFAIISIGVLLLLVLSAVIGLS